MAERLLKVGFDLDDVLLKTAEGITKIYNDRYGTNLIAEKDWYNFADMSQWGTGDFAEARDRVNRIFASDEFADTVEEVPGARSGIEQLHRHGHGTVIITGRPEETRSQTERSVERLFPDMFSSSAIHFTDHFSSEGVKVTKGQVGRELELTQYVEDLIVHAESVAAAGIRVVLLGQRGWNAGETSPDITRVADWQKLGEYFRHEAGQ